jgi:uncharacterized protein YggE
MSRVRLFLASLTLTLALALTAVAAPRLSAQPPMAEGQALPTTITVVGQGKITAAPDRVRLSLGVESVSETAQAASKDNNKRMETVLAALKQAGVNAKDINTAYYTIWTETLAPSGSSTAPGVRYHVSNQVNVLVNDPSKLSALIDTVIEAGATNISGINYERKDTQTLEAQARAEAIKDAQARAADLARLNGARLGPVAQVSEVIGSAAPMRDVGFGGGGPSLNVNELNYTSQVQVVYELQR